MAPVPSPQASVRAFKSDDKAACLSLFDSNTGLYFSDDERPAFEAFLDALPGPYLVGTVSDRIIFCGGYAADRDDPKRAALCWGMVDRAHHGMGYGKQLSRIRLEQIEADPRFNTIRLSTSQHTFGFYEKLGFTVTDVIKDGLMPGLDEVRMVRAARTS